MTGEIEDTDVGFPGPEHHIAEREVPMKIAMGVLAVLAVVGGVLQIPQRERGAAPLPRADVRRLALYEELEPSDRADVDRPGRRRGCSALPGIFIAYTLWVRAAGACRARIQAAVRAAAPAVRQQVVLRRGDRPADRAPGGLGRPLRSTTFERVFVDGALVGGASGARAGRVGRACAAMQTGYLRYYAALLLLGVTVLGAYFLISA